jgi:hypothetical protein
LELGLGIHPNKIASMTPTIRFYRKKMTFILSAILKNLPNRAGTGWRQVKGNTKGKEKSFPYISPF